MAKYSDIKGFTVQTLSTDTVASGISGGAWASGGNLNTTRGFSGRTGAGPQTAAQAAAGFGPPAVGNVEHYDGSSWTETTDVNTARTAATHGGIQTSSLITGGSTALSVTEEWNGSAWTEVNDLNTGRRQLAMSTNGNAEGAVAFGGYAPPTGGPVGYTNITETWNGSSWTETGDLNTSRAALTGTDASSTAALAIAGYRGPPTADRTKFVEEWNGSAWTEIADVNQERMDLGCAGSYTDCIIFAGVDGPTPFLTVTEHWDGTSWTEIADMSTSRCEVGGTGSSTAGLAFGGTTPPYTNATEEFTAATLFNKITEGQLFFNSTTNTFKETIDDIPSTSWTSGANMNTSAQARQNAGNTTAAIAASGVSPGGKTTNVEQYNGSAWTEVADVSVARNQAAGTPASPYTSAMIFAGDAGSPNTNQATSESWNGSSWTEAADLNTARTQTCGTGESNTAALCVSGSDNPNQGPRTAVVEQWDGSSWTEVGDVNAARRENPLCTGTSTSSIFAGGSAPPSTAATESWNGTSWTEVGDLNTAREAFGGGGSSNVSSLAVAGYTTTQVANTELWNGSTWTELNDLSTARATTRSAGSASNCINAGGYTTAYSNLTEEWTSSLANKTITAS